MKKHEKSADYGKLMQKLRTLNRLTQEEVAESIEYSDRQIRNIESGKSDIKLSTTMILWEKYGTTLSEIEYMLNPEIYSVHNETYTLDGIKYIGYGIKGDGIFFEDISVNFTDMKRLVTLCNCFKVEDIHMRDIIEDFLCEG